MAESAKNVGIRNSYTLLAFARAHGKMQVGPFVNSETGEKFSSCIFTNEDDDSKVFVGFSSKLGELTPAQIKAQKDKLQVVELESGKYYLCKKGDGNWEDVDL